MIEKMFLLYEKLIAVAAQATTQVIAARTHTKRRLVHGNAILPYSSTHHSRGLCALVITINHLPFCMSGIPHTQAQGFMRPLRIISICVASVNNRCLRGYRLRRAHAPEGLCAGLNYCMRCHFAPSGSRAHSHKRLCLISET